ncbi:MAG: serine O-acetyltransferase [Alphaproteobacteria bacterium]
MFKLLKADIAACMERDPAARSALEVVLVYPGFHAILTYRIAHWFWNRGLRLVAKWLAYVGRIVTGIEIHPGARIGSGFFIDHGTGVVIGETAEIGDNVTLYHDVTLGGIAPSVDSDAQRGQKRHPTLADDVIVGSGAQILGPITVGAGARVGANSVVLQDVSPLATVVGIPAKVARGRAPAQGDRAAEHPPFQAYGIDADMSDPTMRVVEALLDKVQSLSMRVEELERERGGEPPAWQVAKTYASDDDDEDAAGEGGAKSDN